MPCVDTLGSQREHWVPPIGARIKGTCRSPDMGAGMYVTQVLWKSSSRAISSTPNEQLFIQWKSPCLAGVMPVEFSLNTATKQEEFMLPP